MHLDIATLLVVLAILCLLLGTMLGLVWQRPGSEPSLLPWSASLLIRVPGFALLLQRGSAPDWLTIDLANALLLLGVGLGWAGARQLGRRPARPVWVVAPAVLWLIACQVPSIDAVTGNRLFVFLMLTSVYSGAIAVEFWREAGKRQLLRSGLAALFALNGLFHAGQAFGALTRPLPHNILEASEGIAPIFLLAVGVLTLGAMIAGGLYNDQMMRRLLHRANSDPLTGVLNRRGYAEAALSEIDAGRRRGDPIALMLFDLDHFKRVNDAHGHQAGDVVLCGFCDLLRRRLQRPDLFARLGGEEFGAVLPGVGAAEARAIAEDLRAAIAAMRVRHEGQSLSVTASIGVAAAADTCLDDLMTAADRALYSAKHGGRNRVVGPSGPVSRATAGQEAAFVVAIAEHNSHS